MKSQYVRLAPSTLHLAPECYGQKGLSDKPCPTCPVLRECQSGAVPELIDVPVWQPSKDQFSCYP